MHKVPAVLFLAVAFALALGGTAQARFTQNEIGCAGRATITSPGGGRVTVRATDTTATVPRQGSVAWQGSTKQVSKNHSGSITVRIGPGNVPVADWGDPNDKGQTKKAGTRPMPAAFADVPPGIYLVSGKHTGDTGSCAGEIEVTITGDGSAPWKPIALTGTGLFAAATLAAGIARKP
ncbi:MAG: hypothetical protein ACRDKT_17135 [Actinomycetota bacterium]